MLRKLQSRRNILAISAGLLVLLGTAAALAPRRTRADGGLPIRANFSVAYAGTPNTTGTSFCGGPGYELNVEAHGGGPSTFGPMLFTLHKTVQAAGPLAHGCLELSTANGETLNAIYDIDLGAENDHGFGAGSNGKLTFVGGTGRFRDASGTAALGETFTIIYPSSSFIGGTSAPIQGFATYSVDGTVFLPEEDHQ
jgi:hypothetical protein